MPQTKVQKKPQASSKKKPSTVPAKSPTLTTSSVEKLLGILETASTNIRSSTGLEPLKQPLGNRITDADIEELRDSDLLLDIDIRLYRSAGELASVTGKHKLPGLLKDTRIGEAPDVFIDMLYNHVMRPLRSDFMDALNAYHARAPLTYDEQAVIEESPKARDRLSSPHMAH